MRCSTRAASPAFARRFSLVSKLVWVERIASGILLLAPVVFILVKSPALIILQLAAGIALLAIRVVVHITTLPVEFDASFGKALPVLTRGRYLAAGDLPAARSVLQAAAFTYVAAALATLLDVVRWFGSDFEQLCTPRGCDKTGPGDRRTGRTDDDFTPHAARHHRGRAARIRVAARGVRRLSGQAGARDRAVRGRRQCGLRRAPVRRGHEPGARPAVRGRVPHRRGRQPRRRDGGARDARRLHAVHRLERAAHRQSVRAGQAQLRSAEGFRRDRARQPRAALHRGASSRCRRRPCRS